MIIAIDYDGTYTLDPHFWNEFIYRAIKENSHTVICATMRHDTDEERIEMPHGINIIYTGRIAKLPFLSGLGINPDVWIDDNPEWLYSNAG